MNVVHLCCLVFTLGPGLSLAQQGKSVPKLLQKSNPGLGQGQGQQGVAPVLKQSLVNLAKVDANVPKDNKYLDEFLQTHLQPSIVWDYVKNFDLQMDSRHKFWPTVKMAPFRSAGEPWPMPKHYQTNEEKLYRMNKVTFRLELQGVKIGGSGSDILEDAIKRYTVIIRDRVIEEPYDFVFNYNEKTRTDYENRRLKKYKEGAGTLQNLKIEVKNMEAGHPHIDMDESYTLKISDEGTSLRANEVWGALRGLETFSQILFRKRDTLETFVRWTEVEDCPRFPHRGILMDTSRHFMHKYVIKNVLDGMSYNKFNVLHWHIVDDQSFPYQSEAFPDLSKKGAFHPTLVYSLRDIKEIVAYARLRGIRIVPEFDTPGHMFSWLGHPDMKSKCNTRTGEPITGPLGPVDPVKDEAYDFMSKLFAEIFDTFPDVFIHLGGDELHSECWANDPGITEFMAKNAGLPAYEAKSNPQSYVGKVIGYYFKRLVGTLKETSKQQSRAASFIMWEDVLKNTREIPKDSIVEIWMGRPSMVKSVNDQGYRVIYSSCWYLDNYKNNVLWVDYYKCDPSPYFTDEEEKGKLLGGEACLWAEYITSDNLMTMMWPRASAPAERLWSPRGVKDLVSAARRIQEQRCRMIYRGLPTGHIDGPDYCLRYRNEPLGGDDPLGLEKDDTAWHAAGGSSDIVMSVSLVANYAKYLPIFNIALTLVGLYVIVMASTRWRRRFR